MLVFVVAGAIGCSLISAAFGVASLRIGGILAADGALETWRAWWVGDLMGALIVAPLLLSGWTAIVRPKGATSWPAGRPPALEAVALGLMLVVANALIFGSPESAGPSTLRESYLAFPLLLWAALRFGVRGAAVANFIVSGAAVAGTIVGRGPFCAGSFGSLSESLLHLQAFMIVVVATTLVLGAVSDERRQAVLLRDSLISLASHELRTPLTSLQHAHPAPRAERAGAAPLAGPSRARRRGRRGAGEAPRRAGRRAARHLADHGRADPARPRGRGPRRVRPRDRRPLPGAAARARHAARVEASRSSAGGTGCGSTRSSRTCSRTRSSTARTTPSRSSSAASETRARLAVRDHGVGHRARGPAAHLRALRARRGKHVGGFGLGLWIVRQVVDALGGSIEVESRLGAGSVFIVELPLTPARRQPAGRRADAANGRGPRLRRRAQGAAGPQARSVRAIDRAAPAALADLDADAPRPLHDVRLRLSRPPSTPTTGSSSHAELVRPPAPAAEHRLRARRPRAAAASTRGRPGTRRRAEAHAASSQTLRTGSVRDVWQRPLMLLTSARLLRLLSMLQAREFWSGRTSRARLEVTERTLRRDMDRLRSLGYPVHSTSGTAGGYKLGAGARAAAPPARRRRGGRCRRRPADGGGRLGRRGSARRRRARSPSSNRCCRSAFAGASRRCGRPSSASRTGDRA